MKQAPAIQTVDPKYTPYLPLLAILFRLNVCTMKRHRFSMLSTMTGSFSNQIKPHWVQLAIVSTAVEFIEIIPMGEAKLEDLKL